MGAIGRMLGFSFAAGINLYATTAMLGLASRYHWVDLPDQYRVFDNDWIIGIALLLYVVEFIADKVPWVDSMWDAVHTVIRPIGGALIAVSTIGPAAPEVKAMIGLAGAALATSSHLAKAGTRAAANTSPEPFSNWILSLSEDGFVIGLALLALKYPAAAAIVVVAAMALILALARWLVRALRRSFRSRATA
ncbi:MAG: DUF4126 domain-containing protein [Vicinamibacterales bacterium]|nr:DUF4126 domain-containing protein [Vicinamibacterales bacterium]